MCVLLNPGGPWFLPAASEKAENEATPAPETCEVDGQQDLFQTEATASPAQGKKSKEKESVSSNLTSVLGSSVVVVGSVLAVLAGLGNQVVLSL